MELRLNGKKYYMTREEAEKKRRKGDRIYYNKKLSLYQIKRPKKKKLFSFATHIT